MISVLLTLAVAGVICWLIMTYMPGPQIIKTIMLIFIAICVIYYILNVFGLIGKIHDIPVPRVG